MNASATTEGGCWVERFLRPIVAERLDGDPPHRCLQIAPADEEEAIHLRQLGWTCDVLLPPGAAEPQGDWEQAPLRQEPHALDLPDASYDLLLTGSLGLLLGEAERRGEVIRELGRVCRPGGGLLVVTGNRRCPLDLTGNAARLHGPGIHCLPTMATLQRDFVDGGPFSSLEPLPVNGHFGSTGGGVVSSLIRGLLAWNWRHLANPRHPRAYAGPLNPTLVVWIRN